MVSKSLQAETRKNAELITASGIQQYNYRGIKQYIAAAQTSIMIIKCDYMATFSAVYCLSGQVSVYKKEE